jgi:hypothetical protein
MAARRENRVATFGAFVAVAVAGLFGQQVQADEILNFNPEPISPSVTTHPEFIWSQVNGLDTGTGAHGNGDGHLYGSVGFSAPGLTISVPFDIPGIPGSDVIDGTTSFYDATLKILSGLNAAAPVVNAGGYLIQALTSGTFEIRSSNIAGNPSSNQVLLAGIISSSAITGGVNSSVGAITSDDVTFTSGLVYDALVEENFSLTGTFSFSLLNITNRLAVSGNYLRNFSANGNGLFSAEVIFTPIPEPASLGLLSLVGMTLVRRRRA